MGESFFAGFGLGFESLDHFIYETNVVGVEFGLFIDDLALLFVSEFGELLVEAGDEELFGKAVGGSVIFFCD